MPRRPLVVNQTGTKRWLFHWLMPPAQGKMSNESWWAREDSNLQPDRYERSALTVELRARGASRPARPQYMVCPGAAIAARPGAPDTHKWEHANPAASSRGSIGGAATCETA